MMVESEFAAMSVCIGASAAGARTYTATASQGLLYMAEALYNASGLGLPIVMTVANRAIGSPINIWNDHSDSMSQRDCGWIQLYAETNQEAADLHVQAFRIAEQLSLPVMVCMDGFILTHAYERIDVPTQEQVDAFLPRFEPRQVLDPADPMTIGAMVGPEAFTEVKYLAHAKQMQALDLIPEVAGEFAAAFGRPSGGLVRAYRAEDAETIVVALGSVLGTIEDTIDELREEGVSIGALAIKSFRPFPLEEVRAALASAKRVVVLEKALAVGVGGIVSANVRMALSGIQLHGYTVIAGLGGRPITKALAARALRRRRRRPARAAQLPRHGLGDGRGRAEADGRGGRTGPHAENILREVGIVAGGRTDPADAGPGRAERTEARGRRCGAAGEALPGGHLRGRQPPARSRAAHGAGADGPLQQAHLRPPRLPGLRRGARRALRARRRDARHRRQADRRQRDRLPRGLLDARSRSPPGSCPGSTRCSATPRRSPAASPRRCGPRAARTSASSARAATAAPSTSASAASRGCSSAATTCSSSVTTTRPT